MTSTKRKRPALAGKLLLTHRSVFPHLAVTATTLEGHVLHEHGTLRVAWTGGSLRHICPMTGTNKKTPALAGIGSTDVGPFGQSVPIDGHGYGVHVHDHQVVRRVEHAFRIFSVRHVQGGVFHVPRALYM